MLNDYVETFKIKHYVKNIVVFLPLFFSINFTNVELFVKAFIAFFSFCFISSAVYIMNDLFDIKQDKLHPIKCNRPIACGRISKSKAIICMLILFLLSSFLSFKLSLLCFASIISYFVLNIFYSIYLKKFAIIDAACIAIGFILRIVAGCFAISVIPSPLVILMTFFVSMFFTNIKRKLEIQLVNNSNEGRDAIKELDIETINQFILINAVLSISFYFTYVLDANTIQRAGTNYLYLTTIPFTLIMYRLFLFVNTNKISDDPMHFLEKDLIIKLLLLAYIITLIIVMTILK